MKKNINKQNSFLDDYYKKGKNFDAGCRENQIDKYLNLCKDIEPLKLVCVVKCWQWWDLDVPQGIKESLFEQSKQYASLINADHILFDQQGRFNEGDWVRTSLLVDFHNNCIFETRNTFYLLVGKGTRKTVDPALPSSIC